MPQLQGCCTPAQSPKLFFGGPTPRPLRRDTAPLPPKPRRNQTTPHAHLDHLTPRHTTHNPPTKHPSKPPTSQQRSPTNLNPPTNRPDPPTKRPTNDPTIPDHRQPTRPKPPINQPTSHYHTDAHMQRPEVRLRAHAHTQCLSCKATAAPSPPMCSHPCFCSKAHRAPTPPNS